MSEPAVEPTPAARRAQQQRLSRESRERLRARAPEPRHAASRAAPAAAARNKAAASAASKAGPEAAAASTAAEYLGRAAQSADRARIPTGNRQYQSVILAEFLVAVVVVAGFPIVTGGSPNAQAKGSPSPYDVGDLRQLVALGGVYFILALLSSGPRGRFAAWFGGLVLVGLAFSKYPLFKTAAQNLTVTPDTGLGEQTAQTAEGAV